MHSWIQQLVVVSASLSLLVEAAPQHLKRSDQSFGSSPGGGCTCAPSQGHGRKSVGKAIYFLTNNQDNAVVALPIATDGSLSTGSVTSTGGSGGNSISSSTNMTAGPDALVSQGALTIAGQNIFAINAGANTLSMFKISHWDPTKLTMVGQPVTITGEFPNTVAASAKNKLVCVGSTGAKAGISCSSFSDAGLSKMDALRPFELDQSTPPVGPPNTVSQTFFSDDESRLFTTVKINPNTNRPGFFSVFPVQRSSYGGAKLSRTDTRSSPPGTAVLFGSEPIPGTSSVFVTDASFGAAILSVDSSTNEARLVANQTIDGQRATCWVAISPTTKTAFVADVATNRLVEMSLKDASVLSIVDLSNQNTDPGLTDLRAAGDFVYALSPGNGSTSAAISVLDVSGGQGTGKLLQHFQVAHLGVTRNAVGMAVLV